MFAAHLTPEYAPFAIAFAVMIGIGLIEGVGLMHPPDGTSAILWEKL